MFYFFRIKEIIDLNKTISTPVIQAELIVDDDIEFARRVKGRMEKVILNDISKAIKIVYSKSDCFICIELDEVTIRALSLGIDVNFVRSK